jgi:hypothetical protein
MRVWIMVVTILVAITAGCTRTRTESASPSPTSSVGTVSPSPGATPSAQPVTDYSSFTQSLDAAGFTVRDGERTQGGLLSAPSQTAFIDGVKVSTFEYPSEKAMDDVRSSISPDGYSVPTRTGGIALVEWVATPHFYGVGKLLVLYVGDERRTLRALDLLLGRQFAGG